MKRWHLPTLEASSDKRTAREPWGRRAARSIGRRAKTSRAVFRARVPAHRPRPGRRTRAIRPRGPRACSRAGDLRPRRDRRLGRHRRLRGRNARDVRSRRTPSSPRTRRSTAPAHTRPVAGSRTQHGDGGTTRSTSARKRHRRAARLLTFRRDDEGRLRTSTIRRDRSEQMARRAEESSRSNCGVLGVLDDEVCYWQREAIERRLGASFLEPAGILVRQCGEDHFVGRKAAQRVLDRLDGSESPTRGSMSSPGAASATSSARAAASARASPSAFVNQSSREMPEAGATTRISASSPACARTDARRASAGTDAVATTSNRRGTPLSLYPSGARPRPTQVPLCFAIPDQHR